MCILRGIFLARDVDSVAATLKANMRREDLLVQDLEFLSSLDWTEDLKSRMKAVKSAKTLCDLVAWACGSRPDGDVSVLAGLVSLLKHYDRDVVKNAVDDMQKDADFIWQGARSLIAVGEREAAQLLAECFCEWKLAVNVRLKPIQQS